MDLVVFPVSRHFWKVKVSGNREKTKSLEYGKCPETGKTVKSFEYVKCPETGKTAKSFEYGYVQKQENFKISCCE